MARVSKEPDEIDRTETGPWRQSNDKRMDVKFVEKCMFLSRVGV